MRVGNQRHLEILNFVDVLLFNSTRDYYEWRRRITHPRFESFCGEDFIPNRLSVLAPLPYLLELSSFSLIFCTHENTTRRFNTRYMSLHYSSFSHSHFNRCSIRTLALLISNHAHVTSTPLSIYFASFNTYRHICLPVHILPVGVGGHEH